MATISSTQAGLWSAGSTWAGGTIPIGTDDVTIQHAVHSDGNNICHDLRLVAGSLYIDGNKTLQYTGTNYHGDCRLILDAITGGAKFIGATGSSNTCDWQQGTANSQTNCYVTSLAPSGNPNEIKKTGTGWFYVSGNGSAVNCGGWDCTYTNFTGLRTSDGRKGIGSADFGAHHRRFLHCVFDDCGEIGYNEPYGWGAGAGKDCRVEYSQFINVPLGTPNCIFLNIGAGTGAQSCLVNSFAAPQYIGLGPTGHCDYNYFAFTPNLASCFAPAVGNTVREQRRQVSETHDGEFDVSVDGLFIIPDHIDLSDRILGMNNVGNPHFFNTFGGNNKTWKNVTAFYPHENNVDGGDGAYTPGSNCVLDRWLTLASYSDDVNIGSLGIMATTFTNTTVKHCTAVGRLASGVTTERVINATVCFNPFHSNLFVGRATSATNWAWAVANTLGSDIPADHDNVQGISNNDVWYPGSFTDPGTSVVHNGYGLRMVTPNQPDASNRTFTTGNPGFVDETRNPITFAIYKGYAGAPPTKPAALPLDTLWNRSDPVVIAWLTWKRATLDALNTALMADPMIGVEMDTWVRAGFVPTDAQLDPSVSANQAFDGGTRGAMPFSGVGGGPPPSGHTLFKAVAR